MTKEEIQHMEKTVDTFPFNMPDPTWRKAFSIYNNIVNSKRAIFHGMGTEGNYKDVLSYIKETSKDAD